MKYIFLILIFLSTSVASFAQIDDELGFVFVKAEYLMTTERYDDAIKEFNKVINDNPQYKNALLLRAKAKFVLGAHRGVRNDVLKYIEYNGVSAEAAKLLGLADYALESYDAALNSLDLALMAMPDDIGMLEARADINYQNGNNLSACRDWERAAKLGSGTAAKMAKSKCGMRDDIVVKDKPRSKGDNIPSKPNKQSKETKKPTSIPDREDPRDIEEETASETVEQSEEEIVEEEPEEEAIDLDAVSDIYVDEDLTLVLKNGLGDRKVLEQPNILILSDESGTVSVDVCVSGGGRVVNAVYNAGNSNLKTPSIISLAVRKSKEFWFENSEHEQICGIIEFKVTGRE